MGFAQDEDDPRQLPRSSSKLVLARRHRLPRGALPASNLQPDPRLCLPDLRPSRSSVSGLRPSYAHVPSLQTIHCYLAMCAFSPGALSLAALHLIRRLQRGRILASSALPAPALFFTKLAGPEFLPQTPLLLASAIKE